MLISLLVDINDTCTVQINDTSGTVKHLCLPYNISSSWRLSSLPPLLYADVTPVRL